VPVTAKLSRRFYEAFGDDITNEFVDWFNSVDSQYKSENRELAEGYYARFRADLEATEARLRAEFQWQLASVRADLRGEIAVVRTEASATRADLIKWMFVFWIGNVGAMAGLLLTAVKLLQP
jgi:hypothetical protein